MKKLLYFLFVSSLFFTCEVNAQTTQESSESKAIDGVQKNIISQREKAVLQNELKIKQIETKLGIIDSLTIKGKTRRIDSLQKEIAYLKSIDSIKKAIEITTWISNYQTAVTELYGIHDKKENLDMLISTERFYSEMNEAANPMEYAGYSEWYQKFKKYVKNNEKDDIRMEYTLKLMDHTKDFAMGIPVSGPAIATILDGINVFIRSLRSRDREMREESKILFKTTMELAQFNQDKERIDLESQKIEESLDEFGKEYLVLLTKVVKKYDTWEIFESKCLNSQSEYQQEKYMTETFHSSVNQNIRKQIEDKPFDWKTELYFDMQDIQEMRITFGRLLLRKSENIKQYGELIKKYKNEGDITATKMGNIYDSYQPYQVKFDKTYNGRAYIENSENMYKIY